MDFLTIFVRPPGDLLYFLTTAALSLACLAIVFGQRMRQAEDAGIRRYLFAISGVVAAWALLLIGALATLLFNLDAALVLPPLERAANLLTILLLAWVFLSVDDERWGRVPSAVLAVLMTLTNIGYVVSAAQWGRLADEVDFNVSTIGLLWTIAPLVVVVLGGLLTLVLFRWIIDAPLKFVFFLTLAGGYGGTLLQYSQGNLAGDYAGIIRLGFITAMVIGLLLVFRAMMTRLEITAMQTALLYSQPLTEIPAVPSGENNLTQPERSERPGVSPIERESVQLLRVLGLMLEDAEPENVPSQVVRVSLDVLRAELGALLRIQDANYADITAIYDRSMQRSNSGISLNLDNQPTLVNAIERMSQRPLLVERNQAELSDLYTRLGISQMGPAYFQPLLHDQELVAILMIALPYTRRELTPHEEEILKGIAIIAGGLLSLSYKASEASQLAEERAIQAMVQGVTPGSVGGKDVLAAREEMQASLQLARDQIAELSKQVMQLKLQLDQERNRIANALGDTQEGLSISQRIVAIGDQQERLRQERDQMAARLQEAEAALAGATATTDLEVVDTMIVALRRERDELYMQKERLQAELDDLRNTDSNGLMVPEALQDVLDRMSTEKARLQQERNEISTRLDDLQTQLSVLGIEGGASGLAFLIGKLYEDRAMLRTKNEALITERSLLLKEREQLEERIQREKDRDKMLRALQEQVKHLAQDRDAAIQQRDQLRAENHEIAGKLDSVKNHRARLLAQVSGYDDELKEAHEEQAKLQRQLQRVADQLSEAAHHHDRLLAENQTLKTERDQLLARVEGDRGRMQQVNQEGIGSLQTMIADLSEQRSVLERELNQTRAALAEARNRLDAAEIRGSSQLMPAVTTSQNGYSAENSEVIMGVVQELRTPMTSIFGYIDVLLSETPGILGEMQRQFLQRVASNVNRLAGMIEDLIRVTALDTGHLNLTPVPIDVVAIIEDAITNASMQFREKGLTVNLQLEENLPLLKADRDSFEQIIGQLLTNAYLVSPPHTEISIDAMQRDVALTQRDGVAVMTNCLYVAIADRGGGIMPEDEARVFARKYKAENPLIQGLGDTGVGMAIAKALVEAHGGRLWLESQDGQGSVFHFVLPFQGN